MIRIVLFCLGTLSVVLAQIRCYEGQQTSPGVNTPFLETFCPTSDFCFNSYVKRHHNGDNSYTVSKSCGQPGKCFKTGCEGGSTENRCCCVGDFCNSVPSMSLATVGIIAIIYNLQ